MSTKETRDRRLVLLAVAMTHAIVILLVIRAQPRVYFPKTSSDSWIFLVPPEKPRSPPQALPRPAAPLANPPAPDARRSKQEAPDHAITVPPEERTEENIDWERESKLAAENALRNAERQHAYRDLSALSPAQLDWIKKNQMQPMPPGIHWHHHRVEFDSQSGLPIVWINDYCVLITVFVFCRLGKIIEPDGSLFDHMHDPR